MCVNCDLEVPLNRWGGHLRTLQHREGCSDMQEGVQLIRTSCKSRIATCRLLSNQNPSNLTNFVKNLETKFVELVEGSLTQFGYLKVGVELFGRFLLQFQMSEGMDLVELFQQFTATLDRKFSEFKEKDRLVPPEAPPSGEIYK